MFKPSNFLDSVFFLFFVSFFGLMGYLTIEMNQAEKANNNQPSEFVTVEYEVSKVDSEGIHGDNTKDNTGIYITLDKLQPNQKLKEGDTIRVYFNAADLVEGIEHIEVLANAQ